MALIRLPKHYKETVISNPNAIGEGISSSAETADKFITEISNDGIWVTPDGAKPVNGAASSNTTGWHISNAIELFKQGISYFKVWVENSIAKIRIGNNNSGHTIISPDGMEVFSDADTSVAQFGENVRVGESSKAHVDISGPVTTFYSADHAVVGGIFCDTSDIRQHINDRTYTADDEFVTELYFMNVPSFSAGTVDLTITASGSSAIASFSDYGLSSVTIGNTTWSIGLYESEEHPGSQVELTITRTGDAVAWILKGSWYSSAPIPKAVFGVPGIPNGVVGVDSIGDTEDLGAYSFTEGAYCAATGNASHAQNYHTVAASPYQTAIGCYNVQDANGVYAFIIGNGAGQQGSSLSDMLSRSNAFTVDWHGNTSASGYIRDTVLSGEWNTASGISATSHRYRRSGNVVTIVAAGINLGAALGSTGIETTIGSIPAGYRPPYNVYAQAFYSGGDLGSCYFRIESNGDIIFRNVKTLSDNVRLAFTVTFIV